ncbi:hypothetical protein F5884DRAFT_683658 [Xylogone sp. PMI_703]|nr:hypothetical protein F5884DRAFT_683658 [Xylogone sp. PMI_703]
MLRDDESFPPLVSGYSVSTDIDEDGDARSPSRVYHDDLDDVFGSAPPSPTDVSFDGQHISEDIRSVHRIGNIEVSDIPRLKEKHETEGYRDGVTTGKTTTIQAGFDEGYSLGAVLGLRIGKILGLIEGICSAISSAAKTNGAQDHTSTHVDWTQEERRLSRLLDEARQDLKTESVFGREWWGDDGIWKFKVNGEGDEEKEVLFPDVAASHPLVIKWEAILSQEVDKWGLDLNLMDREEDEAIHNPPEKVVEQSTIVGVTTKQELNW